MDGEYAQRKYSNNIEEPSWSFMAVQHALAQRIQMCVNVRFMSKDKFVLIHNFSLYVAYDSKILNLYNINLQTKAFNFS